MTTTRRRTRHFLTLATALVVVAGLAAAFWPRPVLVDLGPVTRGPLRQVIEEDARARVRDPFVVTLSVTGEVADVLVDPGDDVVGGQTVIARIRPVNPAATDVRTREQALAAVEAAEAALRLARADLKAAEAERDFAEAELDRISRLAERGIASDAQLNQARRAAQLARAAVARAEAAIAMREAELAQARAQLIGLEDRGLARAIESGRPEYVAIVAPISGKVLRIAAEEGTQLAAGQPLVEIGDVATDLEVVADLLSQDAVAVTPGQDVELDNWGGPKVLRGRVVRVDPFAVTKISALGVEEQRVPVTIAFVSPPEDRAGLGHGFSLTARIIVHEAEDVLRVPSSALFRRDGGQAVFVREGDRARLRAVTIGADNGTLAEVLEGLSEGEEVILYPSSTVADGILIAPRHVE